jgi:hypothetical protein
VWNLVSRVKGKTYIEGVWEQDAYENTSWHMIHETFLRWTVIKFITLSLQIATESTFIKFLYKLNFAKISSLYATFPWSFKSITFIFIFFLGVILNRVTYSWQLLNTNSCYQSRGRYWILTRVTRVATVRTSFQSFLHSKSGALLQSSMKEIDNFRY